MKSDGNLGDIFQKHLARGCQWQRIETSTSRGIPDHEYCFEGGYSGWIENKLTRGIAVDISPEQIAWCERRARMRGRVFIAVRRLREKGPRNGRKLDELYLFHGADARKVLLYGIRAPTILECEDGPFNWNWPAIQAILTK